MRSHVAPTRDLKLEDFQFVQLPPNVIQVKLGIGRGESIHIHITLEKPHGMRRANRRHGRLPDNDVSRPLAPQAARTIRRTHRIRYQQMHVLNQKRCARGNANWPVQMQRHISQSYLALYEQFTFVLKVAGPGQYSAVMKRRKSHLREQRGAH